MFKNKTTKPPASSIERESETRREVASSRRILCGRGASAVRPGRDGLHAGYCRYLEGRGQWEQGWTDSRLQLHDTWFSWTGSGGRAEGRRREVGGRKGEVGGEGAKAEARREALGVPSAGRPDCRACQVSAGPRARPGTPGLAPGRPSAGHRGAADFGPDPSRRAMV